MSVGEMGWWNRGRRNWVVETSVEETLIGELIGNQVHIFVRGRLHLDTKVKL